MTVYVDNMYKYPMGQFGRMKMSHLYADTHDELMAMVQAIDVQAKWIQHPGDPKREHFDIAMSKRTLALRSGAVETDVRHWARFARARAEMES